MHRALSTAIRAAVSCLLVLTACTAQDTKRVNTARADTAAKESGAGSRLASTPSGALPPALPVSEHTPVGVRVGALTIWLDSTRLDSAARALSSTSTIGRYNPNGNVVAACFRTSEQHATYVTLVAGRYDSARVVDAIITTDPHAIAPPARCAPLNIAGVQISNSLGLKLGMTQAEVDRILGRGDEGEYILGRAAGDKTPDEVARASSTLVITNLLIERDSLTSLRIHRGPMLPRNYE